MAFSPLVDQEQDPDTAYHLNRRSSSGVLLSPDIDLTDSFIKPLDRLTGSYETDGFYMLKKDSQRRTTLSKVLQQDEMKICSVWMEKIENNHNVHVVITQVPINTLTKL